MDGASEVSLPAQVALGESWSWDKGVSSLPLRQFLGLNLLIICTIAAAIRRRANGALSLGVFVASVAIVIAFVREAEWSYPAFGRLGKVMCTAPLGLGSVLGFVALPAHIRHRYLGIFTAYVNAAVVGNICMMVLVPSDPVKDELRVFSSRLCCLSLVIWLLLEMHAVDWKTVAVENGAFVFVASPPDWIAAHTVYRLVLLSLSCFDSLKYSLLEATTLSLSVALRAAYDPERPISHYFGFADTIAAATTALTTGLFRVKDAAGLNTLGLNMHAVDVAGVALQACAMFYSLWRSYCLITRSPPRIASTNVI